MCWIEAKHKTVFTWHRKSRRWVTGIDVHHYENYLKVQDLLGYEVWLLFLHRCASPDSRDLPYCPQSCPIGLFGDSLGNLKANENHRHDNWGRCGMVYWAHDRLRKLADISEFS